MRKPKVVSVVSKAPRVVTVKPSVYLEGASIRKAYAPYHAKAIANKPTLERAGYELHRASHRAGVEVDRMGANLERAKRARPMGSVFW